jgi:hypothetical protein
MSNLSLDYAVVLSNATEAPESNCTNDYCIPDEDYIGLIHEHIFPSAYEWVLIALHGVVFVAGLVGNALVCLAVYRNATMRTVTNYFIVNLAAADFLVILCCLPPTVIWDVTETWFLGTALCKILLYFQVRQLLCPFQQKADIKSFLWSPDWLKSDQWKPRYPIYS